MSRVPGDPAVWDDVCAALDSQGYPGRALDRQGRLVMDVLVTAQSVFLTHVQLGTIHEVPLMEVKAGKDRVLRLYVRGQDEPKWMS